MKCLIDAEDWLPIQNYRISQRGSKLDEEDVLEIKELLKTDWSLRAIAERFEVSYHAIHKIKCGKNWSWLTGLDKEVSI